MVNNVEYPRRGNAARYARSADGGMGMRVFLSGGGLRSVFGSIGVLLFLHQTGQWNSVRELASVSGGSTVNGALLTAGGFTEDELTDVERLHHLFRNLVADRARPFHTRRRGVIVVGVALLTLVIVGSLVMAIRGWGLAGWQAGVAGLATGLVVVPLGLQIGRRLLTLYLRDVLETATEARRVKIADAAARPRLRDGDRTHIICASGLASRAPYFFFVGPLESLGQQQSDGRLSWGYPIRPTGEQNDYSVGDAVLASSSLPMIGFVRSPRNSEAGDGHLYGVTSGEPLVDGGGSGIFGDQLRVPFATAADRVSISYESTSAPTIMVDAFRHVRLPSKRSWKTTAGSIVRDRISSMIHLIGWVKVVTEALYVNDVLEVSTRSDTTVLRLCETEDRFLPGTRVQLDADTEERIAALKHGLAGLGLGNLTWDRAVVGVTIGFVEAWARILGTIDGLDEALRTMGGDFLGATDPDRNAFLLCWNPAADTHIDLTTPDVSLERVQS